MTHTDTTATSAPERLHELGPSEVDEVFDLLRHPRRRHLLDALGTEGAVPIADLVDAVVDRERAEPGFPPDADQRDQVELALFHSHLPKLEGADVLDCEYARGTVTVDDEGKLALLNRLRSVVAENTV